MAEDQPAQPAGDGRSLCLAVHPLAGVTCTEPAGHDGAHATTTGVRLRWHDPDDPRTR